MREYIPGLRPISQKLSGTSISTSNKNKKKEQQQRTAMSTFVGVATITVLTSLVSIVGFPTMNIEQLSSLSQLNSDTLCKTNALKYEKLGYYTGRANQFNAVMAACAVGNGIGE